MLDPSTTAILSSHWTPLPFSLSKAISVLDVNSQSTKKTLVDMEEHIKYLSLSIKGILLLEERGGRLIEGLLF